MRSLAMDSGWVRRHENGFIVGPILQDAVRCLRSDAYSGPSKSDLYRVKGAVKPLQPFSCLAFPFSETRKTPLKRPIFGDELVTSFCADKPQEAKFGKHIFRTPRQTAPIWARHELPFGKVMVLSQCAISSLPGGYNVGRL